MDKSDFRKKYQSLRSECSSEAIDELSLAIANRALELPIWEHLYFHTFLTISEKKEVDTQYLLHILQGRDKSIVVPKANFSTQQLQHYLLQENTPLEISNFGIPEPKHGIEILPAQLDVVFVPLVAFDIKGTRIGYGKGFYDRFLCQCKEDTLFVGLSLFDAEAFIPGTDKDIPLHYCVTPTKIFTF